MSVTAMKPRNAVESLREVVQDLLVPELKAVKVTVEGIRVEMQLRDEKQTQAIKFLDDKLSAAIKNLDEKQSAAIKHLDEKHSAAFKQMDEKHSAAFKQIDDRISETARHLLESIKQVSDKLDSNVEFRERLAALEADRVRG